MALHPVKLPQCKFLLFRVIALQKRLLKTLVDPTLDANAIDVDWLQSVWRKLDAEWVRKFCLGGRDSVLYPLRVIASADLTARLALYHEFCRQNRVAEMFSSGGDFRDLRALQGFTPQLKAEVTKLFNRCYKLLSADTSRKWNGYEFNGNRCITNRIYKDEFCNNYPTKAVCPYCDGEIGTPELDHYLFKSGFPLLACSPWNLIPVCRSCNDVVTAKGDRPAISIGSPSSTNDWLHPFFRPASVQVNIKLSGTPKDSIPKLHSPDAAEQVRLNNHTDLIPSLSKRWTDAAAAYFDVLVRNVKRKVNAANSNSVDSVIKMYLEDHSESRGRAASSMVHAAVCQAVLDRRPEYLEEFNTPNAPALASIDQSPRPK